MVLEIIYGYSRGLNAWPLGCGTIERYGLAGVDIVLQKVCHRGGEL